MHFLGNTNINTGECQFQTLIINLPKISDNTTKTSYRWQ